ncbi:MAG: polysaccharide deacetylase family protein [Thermoanaerobaculia bacterium]|nr:polysaccharide deacetylase family protein [Thermoanaerobaculia bacterium]
MLTFRNTNLGVGLLLLALLLWDGWHHVPWWFYALLVFVYSLIMFYGVYFIQSGFFMKTLYEGPPDAGRVIALTFDDGPSAEHTPRLLDLLKEHDLKAAFFCIGKNIAGNETLLQRIVQEGHVVGNHSFTHDTWFDLFPVRRIAAELRETDRRIESVTGKRPALFRPPYGVINPNVRDAVRQTGHRVIGWNVRSYDTMTGDNQKLMARLLRLLKPGAVVLLHDHGKKTLDVLPGFIRAARERGYAFVRLDHLLNVEAYV